MKYTMPEIENIKKDFKEFIKGTNEIIKNAKKKKEKKKENKK